MDQAVHASHAVAVAHDPHLQHHFQTPDQQVSAGKLGMWIFLGTEVLLFGGLFCLYAVYRAAHPEIFEYGHRYLDVGWGAINTVVLLLSSFTMAMAVRCAQMSQKRDLVIFLGLTLLCGVDFLGIKFVEYSHKFHDNLVWGKRFYESPGHAAGVQPATAVEAAKPGAAPTGAGPAAAAAAPLKAGDIARGRELFRGTCAACHGLRGEGIVGQGKDMRGSPFIGGLDDAGLLAFVKKGRLPNDPLNTTKRLMPARGGNPMLSDDNLVDIVAYVRELHAQQPATGDGAGGAPPPTAAVPATPETPAIAAASSSAPADDAAAAAASLTNPPLERSVIPPAPPGPAGLLLANPSNPSAEPPHYVDPRRDAARPANVHLFFSIYFAMTGLHGLHVLAGMVVIGWLLLRSIGGAFSSAYFTPVDLGGLYWHLVDLIWIFLFPLLYLIH
jgi:cytochrome c oxidase subunit 3